MTDRTHGRTAAVLFMVASTSLPVAEPGPAEPISAEATAAIQQILEARRAESKQPEPLAEFARAIREVRMRLREVARNAPGTGGTAETLLVESALGRAREALSGAVARASEASRPPEGLEAIQARFDELAARVAALKAETGAARGARALELLRDLEAEKPERERSEASRLEQPAWRPLPSASFEPGA
jgi:hypothetical protein